jgi:hypothetical protein
MFTQPCRITPVLTHACSHHLGLLLHQPSHSRAHANRASSALRARSAQHLSTPPTSVRHRLHARATRSASLTFLPLQLPYLSTPVRLHRTASAHAGAVRANCSRAPIPELARPATSSCSLSLSRRNCCTRPAPMLLHLQIPSARTSPPPAFSRPRASPLPRTLLR